MLNLVNNLEINEVLALLVAEAEDGIVLEYKEEILVAGVNDISVKGNVINILDRQISVTRLEEEGLDAVYINSEYRLSLN